MQLILVLACVGVVQSLFLCTYLFTLRSGNRRAHIFLGLLLLGLSIRIGKSVFNFFLDLDPWMRNLGLAGFLMVGPSLYAYVLCTVEGRIQSRTLLATHYSAAAVYLTFSWLIPNEQSLGSYLSYSFVLLHCVIYMLLAENTRRIARRRQYLPNELNQWLRQIILGLGLVWLFYLLVFAGLLPFYIGGAILYSILIYIFSYLILQKHRFSLDKYVIQPQALRESRRLLDRLTEMLESSKLFLDPQLKLDTVAKRLSEDPRAVSRAVNEHLGQNFPEFINGFRVAHAKCLLLREDSMKVATAAIESGFGNVTSFNLAFKAEEGVTPSEFRKRGNRRHNHC